jgi:hypothetical protein
MSAVGLIVGNDIDGYSIIHINDNNLLGRLTSKYG